MALIDAEAVGISPEPLPLRTLEQRRADSLARLLPALDGAVIALATGEQFTVRARAIADADAATLSGYWLVGGGPQPSMHFKQWDGAPVILHPERIADIATVLTRADALLSALETRLGMAIEPDHIQSEAPQDRDILALDFHGSGGLQHQLLLQ